MADIHQIREVLVRGTNQAHRPSSFYPIRPAHCTRHLAIREVTLVEVRVAVPLISSSEKRPTIGRLETPFTIFHRAGERALHMAEQFRLDQCCRYRTTQFTSTKGGGGVDCGDGRAARVRSCRYRIRPEESTDASDAATVVSRQRAAPMSGSFVDTASVFFRHKCVQAFSAVTLRNMIMRSDFAWSGNSNGR